MKTVHIYRASAIGADEDTAGEPTTIVVGDEIPEINGEGWEKRARQGFRDDGKSLADALLGCLPGGTVDQLLCELLRRRASLFRVKF